MNFKRKIKSFDSTYYLSRCWMKIHYSQLANNIIKSFGGKFFPLVNTFGNGNPKEMHVVVIRLLSRFSLMSWWPISMYLIYPIMLSKIVVSANGGFVITKIASLDLHTLFGGFPARTSSITSHKPCKPWFETLSLHVTLTRTLMQVIGSKIKTLHNQILIIQ